MSSRETDLSLTVFRHAKAERAEAYAADHERALQERGRDDARTMGRFLASSGEPLDLVVASSALRTRQTAEIAAEAGRWSAPIEVRPELYENDAGALLRVLRETGPAARHVLVVGHEPSCSELVGRVTGGVPPHFSTGTMARMQIFVRTWDALVPGCGQLLWLVAPRLLR
jgi:phosphohistidine phosphatase